MLRPSLIDVAIIAIKGVDYRFGIHDISKSKPIHICQKTLYLKIVVIYKKFTSKNQS